MRGLAMLFLSAGLAAASLAACAPARDSRGYVLNERAVEAITPGQDTRDTVLIALGTPSAVGTFQRNNWYYVSAQTEQVAYRRPEVTDQQVVAIEFTDAGLVANVQRYTLADAMDINPVNRETPTRGRELNAIQQLLGNVGRFNTQSQRGAAGP